MTKYQLPEKRKKSNLIKPSEKVINKVGLETRKHDKSALSEGNRKLNRKVKNLRLFYYKNKIFNLSKNVVGLEGN